MNAMSSTIPPTTAPAILGATPTPPSRDTTPVLLSNLLVMPTVHTLASTRACRKLVEHRLPGMRGPRQAIDRRSPCQPSGLDGLRWFLVVMPGYRRDTRS